MDEVINLARYRHSSKARGKGPNESARLNKNRKPKKISKPLGAATLLTDMMRSPAVAPPLARGKPLLKSGVLACRRGKKGKVSILLISTRSSKKWGIPKGRTNPTLTLGECAAKEAFEEAGVTGDLSPHAIGMFRARRRTVDARGREIIEVWIYLLEVKEIHAHWPEKGKRQTRWVSCERAARHLGEPVLVQLCHKLAHS